MGTILRSILSIAASCPDRAAIGSRDETWSYATLIEKIAQARRGLVLRGVKRQDRVLLEAVASCEFVAAYFACHSVGAIAVPVSPRTAPTAAASRIAPVLACRRRASRQPPDEVLFQELFADELSGGELPTPHVDDPAEIIFTSGTSGEPKPVVLSHRNISASATQINTFIGTGPDDREVLALPLYHSFGLGRLRSLMSIGGYVQIVPGFSPPQQVIAQLGRSRATVFAFVPAVWALFRETIGDEFRRFSTQLKFIEIGSAAMPMEDKQELLDWFPSTRICMHYGLTEASRSTFLAFADDARWLRSAGRPSAGVEITIHSQAGVPVPRGTEGEIWIRGDHVARFQWADEGPVPREGDWLQTADLGVIDDDGYLTLLGRSDDVINVRGFNVHPAEVEAALCLHPAVAEAACVGVDDPDGLGGQRVAAFVVPARSAEVPAKAELVAFLKDKIAPHMIPVLFVQRTSLPRSANGKLLRKDLGPANE